MDTYLPIETIQRSIYVVRGQKVMLDSELAALYGVPTHRLNEAVKRNLSRFPEDFMIQVTEDEWKNLISQFAISSLDSHGGRRSVPKAFTELGIAMLSSVLRSDHAVQVNIQIMRAFVAIRQAFLSVPSDQRLATLEDASRLHGDRLDAIETTLVAMEEKPQSVNITVQGDMIGNTISLGAVLDKLGAKAPQLGFDTADGHRFQNALQEARINPPHTSRGRAALHTLKRMLESVAEHAGGAVVEHVVLAQLGRFLGQAFRDEQQFRGDDDSAFAPSDNLNFMRRPRAGGNRPVWAPGATTYGSSPGQLFLRGTAPGSPSSRKPPPAASRPR